MGNCSAPEINALKNRKLSGVIMDKRAQKGIWIFCILLCSLVSMFSSSFAYGLEKFL